MPAHMSNFSKNGIKLTILSLQCDAHQSGNDIVA